LGEKFPIRLESPPPDDEDNFEFQNYFLIKNKRRAVDPIRQT